MPGLRLSVVMQSPMACGLSQMTEHHGTVRISMRGEGNENFPGRALQTLTQALGRHLVSFWFLLAPIMLTPAAE